MTTALGIASHRRALYVSPSFTVLDGSSFTGANVRQTPGDTWSKGLGALLDRIAPQFDGEGVIVLDGAALKSLGLPTGPDDTATSGFESAEAAGWKHGKPSPWTTFYAEGRPTVIVGMGGWPDFQRALSVTDGATALELPFRLAMWHELTGYAWRGSPGIAGMTILRETLPKLPMKGSRVRPSLKMTEGPDNEGACELDITADDWSRPLDEPYAHGYDATRMYLAAAQSCEVLAPWKLQRTGRRKFDLKKAVAGWWKVELGPWNDDRIPAPAGPGEKVRWVTTPTLILLAQLREQGGAFQDFEVLDSYTADGRRLLRGWAETLETAYQGARSWAMHTDDPNGFDQDGEAVRVAVKAAYRETIGLLKPNSGWGGPVYRADWHYSLIAHARSTLWRKAWRVGLDDGRWPLEIQVDQIWYGSPLADPRDACPAGLPLLNGKGQTDALGTFKVKGTRERGKA